MVKKRTNQHSHACIQHDTKSHNTFMQRCDSCFVTIYNTLSCKTKNNATSLLTGLPGQTSQDLKRRRTHS